MNINDLSGRKPTWCPGCGNFGIWAALKNTIIKLNWQPHEFVIVYGVGCSGNMTDFIKSHGFHSLHGRAVPNAIGIKLANHNLKVVCIVGDGDCYGEGGNHLLHAIRGNHDIKVIVHDNRVYGLTTGQTAPTADKGYKSKSTPFGVIEQPVNALALAVMQGASFVAQGFAGDLPHLSDISEKGLTHKGLCLIDVLQPCVTFNKVNTYEFYRNNIIKLAEKEDELSDKKLALNKTLFNNDKIPVGIFYRVEKMAYHEQVVELKEQPLVMGKLVSPDLKTIFQGLS